MAGPALVGLVTCGSGLRQWSGGNTPSLMRKEMITMTLRVIGAGVARTGTASLKLALEQLLGGPGYHMFEVFANPAHIPARQLGRLRACARLG